MSIIKKSLMMCCEWNQIPDSGQGAQRSWFEALDIERLACNPLSRIQKTVWQGDVMHESAISLDVVASALDTCIRQLGLRDIMLELLTEDRMNLEKDQWHGNEDGESGDSTRSEKDGGSPSSGPTGNELLDSLIRKPWRKSSSNGPKGSSRS